MIFVVAHGDDGVTVEYGDELNTEDYEDIKYIFFCDNEEEAEMVVHEVMNWGVE
jgi:hypothetical protein